MEEWGCGKLGTDFSQVIAIDVRVHSTVEETDTLRGHAVAFTAGGDSVAADVVWASLDTAFLGVADSANGVFVGRQAGIARLQARTGTLRSNPIAVRVTAAADTLTATSATHDTISVATHDSLSDSLAVLVQDTITNPAPSPPTASPLANRPVTFTITSAPAGASVTLVTDDTTHAVTATDTVRTSSAGVAVAKLRYLGGGTLPDSVVIVASALRAVGTIVPGSPISFVVRLVP